MSITPRKHLTGLARRFVVPQNATHRQYEALRAYLVEGASSTVAAQRFGYTTASLRFLVHEFRRNPKRQFFLVPAQGRPKRPPKEERVHLRIIALRKLNLSIYDIQRFLDQEKVRRSTAAIAKVLSDEGFARLPRRADDERPSLPRPEAAAIANAGLLDLSERSFRTQFGGLFLFVPYLARLPFDRIMEKADLPGTKMIPAGHAMRALLGLKLQGSARKSHVMGYVFDDGLALFAGLNAIPKRQFLTDYSCRIDPHGYPILMRLWFDAMGKLGLERGASFDLDFHSIPHHGEDALMQKHYISKRSRRQKGILAFLARDADKRMFCYANAEIRKEDQNDEILRFLEFWKKRTGHYPEELVFDSKLTTYENLDWLNKHGIAFITLRRRSPGMLEAIEAEPPSAWTRITLKGVSRKYQTPRILDRRIELDGYTGDLRQITVADLGHEEPTLLVTNQLRRSGPGLIERYAQRMLIENEIADGVDFFHMDALSSTVPMKINCDLQLTLMGSSLYHLLGAQLGNGYAEAKSRHIFRHFIEATATVTIGRSDIVVRYQKRAHNPFLLAAGFDKLEVPVPWLGRKRLRLQFG